MMENPIVITPQEIINTILAFCGAVITISAALTIIIKASDKMKQPNKRQDERIEALEVTIKDIKDQLRENIHQFSLDELRVNDLETAQKEINMLILESLQAITDHDIDGNNIDALKESKKKLDQYLINKAS